jgi:hypothetical protein
MLVATFGESTAWVGKTITWEEEQFFLEGYGGIVAERVVDYDRQGHLIWPYPGMRAWVYARAGFAPLASTSAVWESVPSASGGSADQRHKDDFVVPAQRAQEARDESEMQSTSDSRRAEDRALDVRRGAVIEIGVPRDPAHISGHPAAPPDSDTRVRSCAALAIEGLTNADMAPALLTSLRNLEEDEKVRVEAARALALLPRELVAESLAEFVGDDSERVRAVVAEKLNPQIVEEWRFQRELQEAAGGRWGSSPRSPVVAELAAEPDNRRDQNAVSVKIEGVTVGYLRADDAAEYGPALRECLCGFPCAATITRRLTSPDRGEELHVVLTERVPSPDELRAIPGYCPGSIEPTASLADQPGYLLGKHYTQYAELVGSLERAQRRDGARILVTALITAWLYERLAGRSPEPTDREREKATRR